ncbi:MAG: cyclic nucleotide-binding domain-containing protein [Gammaproteobacteria bacterium]|nr:cyclic nucleotide-binding domain-containing protein [Gammaproteobacteria bacterium]
MSTIFLSFIKPNLFMPESPSKPAVTDPDSLLNNLELLGYGPSFNSEVCEMLEACAMFNQMERNDIELIAEHFLAYVAEPDTMLLKEGHFDPFMCLLTQGKLAVNKEKGAYDTAPTRLATILPGRTIGEMSLIDGQPHSASVVTLTKSTLLVLTRDRLNALSRTYPKTANRLILKIAQLLSHRLRQTSGKLVDYL